MEYRKIPAGQFAYESATLQFYESSFQKLKCDIWIKLKPVDTGLDWVSQPEETDFRLEETYLPVKRIADVDGKEFHLEQDDNDGSIYIGARHNPVDIPRIIFTKKDEHTYNLNMTLMCAFEFEGVGKNETIDVNIDAKLIHE